MNGIFTENHVSQALPNTHLVNSVNCHKILGCNNSSVITVILTDSDVINCCFKTAIWFIWLITTSCSLTYSALRLQVQRAHEKW